jgi:hypothetical protein
MSRSRKRTNQRDASKPRAGELAIRVRPVGPTPQELERIAGRLLALPNVKTYFGRSRHRLLTIEALSPDDSVKSRRTPAPIQRFRATIYDDTRQRTVFADGLLARPSKVNLTESSIQPPVTAAEFAEAVRHIARDENLGTTLREAPLATYAPMPPLVPMTLPDGRSQRVISVGLLPGATGTHEIVGVDAASGALHRFPDRAPRGARADSDGLCGAPVDANQPTADRGTAGQAWITVTQAGKTLWKFLVVRPAASSGTNGSGVELRYVDYRGKRLLYRAHVPILNVKYDGDACGPYRDWQWQEGEIRADGIDVAPGFRLCTSPAQTIFDTGSDTGNFLGTAIYVQGQEVVLVSELQAGWYRYISQWRLHVDGTIRPRFAFGAVSSSCVCNVHHHHAYWRFDFDLRTPGNNVVREFNATPLVGRNRWHDLRFEVARPRDPARHRKWRVENTKTGEAYDIVPGDDDGVETASSDSPFGRGDLWILRYHGDEIDDGVQAIGPPYEANISQWVDGEPVYDDDVVVWYGAHFTHDLAHDPPTTHGHIVGPDLKLVRW